MKAVRKSLTPSYHYFPEETEKNIEIFKPLPKNDIQIFYAIKANNYQPIIERFIQEGYGFDVASIEEIDYLLSLGANPDLMSFSAPTKLEEDLKIASVLGIKRFAFDSEIEFNKIIKNTKRAQLFARIATKNKDAEFNLSDKFGMTTEYYIEILKLAKRKKYPIHGLTFHVGSQNKSITSWKMALNDIEKIVHISKEYGIEIKCINLGGGVPIQYENGVKSREYYIRRIIDYKKILQRRLGIEEFIIEPGRALAATTMILLTKIVNIKPYKNPSVLVTDTSVFNGIIEPLEHFEYPVYEYNEYFKGKISDKKKFFKIAGISCDGYDIINKRSLLPSNIKAGDYLVIPNTGAYSFVYENFHMRSYPKIINTKE